jgi:hypothetical protein
VNNRNSFQVGLATVSQPQRRGELGLVWRGIAVDAFPGLETLLALRVEIELDDAWRVSAGGEASWTSAAPEHAHIHSRHEGS